MSQFLWQSRQSGNIPAAVPNWEWECNKSEAAEEPDNGTLNFNSSLQYVAEHWGRAALISNRRRNVKQKEKCSFFSYIYFSFLFKVV